jgi:hypothetical protein
LPGTHFAFSTAPIICESLESRASRYPIAAMRPNDGTGCCVLRCLPLTRTSQRQRIDGEVPGGYLADTLDGTVRVRRHIGSCRWGPCASTPPGRSRRRVTIPRDRFSGPTGEERRGRHGAGKLSLRPNGNHAESGGLPADGALPVFNVQPGSRGKLPRPFLRRWRLAICHGSGIRRGSSVSGIVLA